MLESSGAHFGDANSAILIALIKKLVKNGTLTKHQASEVLDDAVEILRPSETFTSIGAAMRLIRTAVSTQIAA